MSKTSSESCAVRHIDAEGAVLRGDRIQSILTAKGDSQAKLAVALGRTPGQISRLLNNKNQTKLSLAVKIASFLRVDLSEIIVRSSQRANWKMFHLSQTELLTTFHQQLCGCRIAITVTDSIDSYLQDEWMLEWSNVKQLNVPDWSTHKKIFLPYVQEQRQSRDNGNYRHFLISPEQMLYQAVEQNPDWLAQLRWNLGNFREVTAAAFVRNWEAFRKSVDGCLPREAVGWQKVSIVDEAVALIHFDHARYYMCQQGDVVKNLRAALLQVIDNNYSWPTLGPRNWNPAVLSESGCDQIEALLRKHARPIVPTSISPQTFRRSVK